MKYFRVTVVAMLAAMLAGCATQQAMTVGAGDVVTPVAKYRQALAVGEVKGGQAMNVLTVPGVTSEAFKAALESSLAANSYMAQGTPKYVINVEIQDLKQPLMGLDLDVTSSVIYRVTGGGTTTPYNIQATATAGVSDSLIAADRMRVANERAMKDNIRKFLQALR